MEKKMETTIRGLGSRRNGQENGNTYHGFMGVFNVRWGGVGG